MAGLALAPYWIDLLLGEKRVEYFGGGEENIRSSHKYKFGKKC